MVRKDHRTQKGSVGSAAEAEKGEVISSPQLLGTVRAVFDYSAPSPQGLEVAIRNKIEQEVTQRASSSLHKPLAVVKGAEPKGPPAAGRPGGSSK